LKISKTVWKTVSYFIKKISNSEGLVGEEEADESEEEGGEEDEKEEEVLRKVVEIDVTKKETQKFNKKKKEGRGKISESDIGLIVRNYVWPKKKLIGKEKDVRDSEGLIARTVMEHFGVKKEEKEKRRLLWNEKLQKAVTKSLNEKRNNVALQMKEKFMSK